VIDIDLALNRAGAITVQEDGGFVVSGETTALDRKAFNFVRLSAGGELDLTFGPAQDGRVTVYVPGNSPSKLAPPLVRTRSEALVAGTFNSAPVVGRIDLAAATAVLNGLQGSSALPEALLLQPDGRLLIAGAAIRSEPFGTPLRDRTWLARADGELVPDTSFGANGVFTTADTSDNDGILGLALERAGKILSAGYSTTDRANPASGVRATLRRFLPGGSPDPSFASGGVLQLDLAGGTAGLEPVPPRDDDVRGQDRPGRHAGARAALLGTNVLRGRLVEDRPRASRRHADFRDARRRAADRRRLGVAVHRGIAPGRDDRAGERQLCDPGRDGHQWCRFRRRQRNADLESRRRRQPFTSTPAGGRCRGRSG
jgi:hypothetical protein